MENYLFLSYIRSDHQLFYCHDLAETMARIQEKELLVESSRVESSS